LKLLVDTTIPSPLTPVALILFEYTKLPSSALYKTIPNKGADTLFEYILLLPEPVTHIPLLLAPVDVMLFKYIKV